MKGKQIMDWYKVTMSAEQVREGHNLRFMLAYAATGFPLFEQKDWRPTEPLSYYIPAEALPHCQHLTKPYSVESCPEPKASEVTLACGDSKDYDLLK